MFSTIDQTLFPDECVVLELPHTRYVYPIFKNGSSSLFKCKDYRVLTKDQLKDLSVVDVYVRDPHERFLTGVQTFIENLGASVDKSTVLYFVENYLYLNRHYTPQIFWLLNLSRYTRAKFHLKPMSMLQEVTAFKDNVSIKDSEIESYFKDKIKVKFFNEVDEVLTVNLINRVVSLEEILFTIKQNYRDLYQEMFGTSLEISNVLHKT